MDTVEGFSACEGKQKKCMNQLMTEMGDKREIIDDGEEKVGLIFCLQVKFFFSFSYTLDLPCRMYWPDAQIFDNQCFVSKWKYFSRGQQLLLHL